MLSYDPTKHAHRILNLGLEEVKLRDTVVTKIGWIELIPEKIGNNVLPQSHQHFCVVDVIYSKNRSTEEINENEEENYVIMMEIMNAKMKKKNITVQI